jgi:hypothetical protein
VCHAQPGESCRDRNGPVVTHAKRLRHVRLPLRRDARPKFVEVVRVPDYADVQRRLREDFLRREADRRSV